MRARQQLICWRAVAVFIIIGIFVFSYAQPFADFARNAQVNITPYAIVFIIDDYIAQLFLMLGAVALCAGAPFIDEQYPYLIARCGRRNMVLGNVLTVVLMTGVYVAFIYMASVLPMLDVLAFDKHWGKAWTTLAVNTAPVEGAMISINELIRSNLSPRRAMFINFFLEWGCATILGLTVYLFNRITDKPAGLWAAAGLVMLDTMIYNMLPNTFNGYSPLSLSRLSTFLDGMMMYTFFYGVCFFALLAIVMTGALVVHEHFRRDVL